MISEQAKRRIVVVLTLVCVATLVFSFGQSLFASHKEATPDSKSVSSTGKHPTVEGTRGDKDPSSPSNDPTATPGEDQGAKDEKSDDDRDDSDTKKTRKAKSKKAAVTFVKHFYDQTAKKPHGHIKASKPYMTNDFYQYMKKTYPMEAIGPEKQEWKDVTPSYFGKKDDFRIWDVAIQGRITKKGGKHKKDHAHYIVKVTRHDGDYKIDQVWINSPVGRDKQGYIDLYHGKGHGNNDDDVDVLMETLDAYNEAGS